MNENLLTIDDICHELGIGKSTAYKLLKSKKIKSCFISCLPSRIQAEVKREVLEALKDAGIDKAEMKTMTAEAMASRVDDIENLIEIRYF